MVDDKLSVQLVPWPPALEQHLDRSVMLEALRSMLNRLAMVRWPMSSGRPATTQTASISSRTARLSQLPVSWNRR